MSLSLDNGTVPKGLIVKTYGHESTVHIGDYEISLEDFLATASYVLTNTKLREGDPRLAFVKYVLTLKKVPSAAGVGNVLRSY